MLNDPFTGEPSIPFTLYAMECEGDIDSLQGRYNRMIKELRERAQYEIIDESAIIQAAYAADLNEPTPEEIDDIIMEVLYGQC